MICFNSLCLCLMTSSLEFNLNKQTLALSITLVLLSASGLLDTTSYSCKIIYLVQVIKWFELFSPDWYRSEDLILMLINLNNTILENVFKCTWYFNMQRHASAEIVKFWSMGIKNRVWCVKLLNNSYIYYPAQVSNW